jgi:glucose-6-phosphate 1-epimerase
MSQFESDAPQATLDRPQSGERIGAGADPRRTTAAAAAPPSRLSRPSGSSWPSQLQGLHLQAADGASAVLSRMGAQLLSWRTEAGDEQLFMGQPTGANGPVDHRGGAPVVFPQFAQLGPLPTDGFACTSLWQVLTSGRDAQGNAFASLGLEADARTRALWDHDFACEFTVRVGGNLLQTELQVYNRSERAWSFQAALRTPLRVNDLSHARLFGLGEAPFLTQDPSGPNAPLARGSGLPLVAGLNRTYPQAPPRLLLREGARRVDIMAQGFADTVLCNPGPRHGALVPDVEPQAWRHLLCVAAANVVKPTVLQPGEHWAGVQRLTVMLGS